MTRRLSELLSWILLMSPQTKYSVLRRHEEGFALVGALILCAVMGGLTVTWARHALLAKESLVIGRGASEADEASRSGMERIRHRVRQGSLPGVCDSGDEDVTYTADGRRVVSDREVLGHGLRQLGIRVGRPLVSSRDEAVLRVRAEVVPAGGGSESSLRTRLTCQEGASILSSPLAQFITGTTHIQGGVLDGFFIVENGAELILEDVVVRGALFSRAGLCKDTLAVEGIGRPSIRLLGDCRLLARTELPDVCVVAPDGRLTGESPSRVELRGFVAVDEVRLLGQATCRGMIVARTHEEFSEQVTRPGFGRGVPTFPESIDVGAERIVRVGFPRLAVDAQILDAMEAFEVEVP